MILIGKVRESAEVSENARKILRTDDWQDGHTDNRGRRGMDGRTDRIESTRGRGRTDRQPGMQLQCQTMRRFRLRGVHRRFRSELADELCSPMEKL
ncbi:unnamed protein product [Caenorhabditis sp. 36 PRJEB53466]|nr:unnamed protein product [Caenorhabditis sp. 36 PRJEB53466]